jgi:DnaD/phage-associated family protein
VKGGIPRGARYTPVPDVFFSRLMPTLEDPVLLEVALVALWRCHRRPARLPPAVGEAELLADPTLRRGLVRLGLPEAELDRRVGAAVERLVAEGLLVVAGGDGARWVLINDANGRAAAERLALVPAPLPVPGTAGAAPASTRRNIFALYEDSIGLVTPVLADVLREAEEEYPAAWLERAFRLAADNNARRWSYVRAILERWARDGVDDEGHRRDSQAGRERDSDGPYAAWFQH